MSDNELHQDLEKYKRWKLSIIPIGYKKKIPPVDWGPFQIRRASETQLNKWFGNGKSMNIGFVCGKVSDNLVVLDYDDERLFREFAEKCKKLRGTEIQEETPVVATGRGNHVYLRVRNLPRSQQFNGWEIRADGNYVVAPPSVHPDGPVYKFVNPNVSILEVDDLRDVGIEIAEEPRGTHKDASWVEEALKGVPEGQRDDTCIKLAGHYKAKGLSHVETLDILKATFAPRCTPPFPDKEVEKCVNSSYGYLVKEANTQAEALAEAKGVVAKWLKLTDPDLIDVALATVIANKAEGEPLWLLLVGAPSTGKSEVLRGLFGCQNVQPLGGFTANTFASGFEKKNVGLLETLPNHTTLVVKDFGTLFTMRREDRGIVLQQLREIYDGQYRKDYGNGKVVGWKGTMGLLAGCTSAIEKYHAVIGELGDRYIIYRLRLGSDLRESVAGDALEHEGEEAKMRGEIGSAFKDALDKAPDPGRVAVPQSIKTKVKKLSDVTTRLRTPVSRDPYSKNVIYPPEPEGPPRLVKALAKLGKALAAVRGKMELTEDEYKVICKVALDTIPRRRVLIVGSLLDLEWKLQKQIGEEVNLPNVTVGRELEDLALLHAVSRKADSLGQTAAYKWQLNDTVAESLEASGLKELIKKAR